MTIEEPVDVKSIRTAAGMKQNEFAKLLGVSVSLVQSWEQGRREPSGTARRILQIMESNPDAVIELLSRKSGLT